MTDHVAVIADAQHAFAKHQTWTEERDVLLGDVDGTVIAPLAKYPRSVWWHNLPGETHERGTAVLSPDSNILYEENAAYATNPPHIVIGKPPRSEIWTVKGGASTVAALQTQSNVSQIEQLINRAGNPHVYNIIDFRIRETVPPSSSIYIEAGMYEPLSTPGVSQQWAGGIVDLSTTISGIASGKHRMGLIYFDRGMGAPGVVSTADLTPVGSLPSPSELGATTLATLTLSAGQDPKGVVYLYYGQTILQESYIYRTLDPRFASTGSALTIQLTASADTTVASTAAETSLLSTINGNQTFAANALSTVGRTLRLTAWGYVGDILTPTLQIRFKLGSTTILDTGAVTLVTLTGNKLWRLDAMITVQTAGASGKLKGQAQFTYNQLTTDIIQTAQTSIDLTPSLLADLTAQWSTSSSSNTITQTNLSLEILN